MELKVLGGRQCGECNACCKPFAVPEVGKRDAGWCSHCDVGKGCTIYASRPFACSAFRCEWIKGSGPESMRPDRIGVMLLAEIVRLKNRKVIAIHFWEGRKNALEQNFITEMVAANAAVGYIIVRHRITGATSYERRVSAIGSHFTSEEITEFRAHFSKEND